MTENETKERIRAIMSMPNARAMPLFANHIAFEIDCDAEAAAAMMAAAAIDMAALRSAGSASDTWVRHKSEAGTLGLSAPAYSDGPAAAGWAKAAEEANRRFADEAV